MNINEAQEILQDNIWTTPDSYTGHNPVGEYCIYSRYRDSQIITECNFDVIHELLNTSESEIYTFRASCSMYGWIEYIILPHNAPDELIIKAAEIVAALSDYPVLDESRYSDAQYNAAYDYWEGCSMNERIEICKDSGLSIFAARGGVPCGFEQSEMFY